jgi:HrpA-like RNA helicase
MNQFAKEPQSTQDSLVQDPTKQLILPIDGYKDNILEAVANNDSTVLVGETGSGKTTKTPLDLSVNN